MSDLHWRTTSILLQDSSSLSTCNGVIPNSLPKQTCRLSLLSNDPIGSINNDYLFRNAKLKMTKHGKNSIPNTFLPPPVIGILPRSEHNTKEPSMISSLTKKRKAEEHTLSEHSMPPVKNFGSEEVWHEPTIATVLDASHTSFLTSATMAHLLRTSRSAIVDLPVPCPTFSNSQIVVPFFTSVTNSTVNPVVNTMANDSTANKANNDGDYRIVVGEHITSLSTMYEVLTFLGRGTFGQVVKARCLTTQTLVAIKILKSHPSYQRQGNVEISILQALSKEDTDAHNLVRAIECFQHCNHTCLVFELLEQNLYDYLKAHKFRPLSLREIRPITQQVLVALCKLKELGFIHADLKPENIMLVNEGGRDSVNNVRFRVKVIDFGSACHQSKAVPNTYLQSRYYRAPEILLGLPFNESIDMWSLGCVVAELYLGWPLYPGSVEYDQMRYIVETQGLPPMDMLLCAPKNNRYFKIDSQTNYRLKRPDEYTAETGQRSKEARKFKFSSLTAIEDAHRGVGGGSHSGNDNVSTARLLERGLSMISDEQQTDAFVDALDRREFVTLLCSMLILPSGVRITPDSALQHPFITLMHLQPYLDCSQRARDSLYMMQVCRHSNYQSPKPPPLTPCARTPLLEMRMSSASLQSTGAFVDTDQISHRPTVAHLLPTKVSCTHDNQIVPPGFDSGNYFVAPANYLGVASSTASTVSVFQPTSHFTSSSNIQPVSLSAVLTAPQFSLGTADVINMCMVNRSHPSVSINTTVQDPLYSLNGPIINTMEVPQIAKAHQQLASMTYGQFVNGVTHPLQTNPTNVITRNRLDSVLVRPPLNTYAGSDVRPTNVLLSVTSALGNNSHCHHTVNSVSNMNTSVPHLLYSATSVTSNGYSTKTTQQPCAPAVLYVAPAQLTDVVNSTQPIPQTSQPVQPFNLVAFLPSAHSTSTSVLTHPSVVDITGTARAGISGVSNATVPVTAGATYAYLPSRNVNLFVSPTEQHLIDNLPNKERYLVNGKEAMSVLTLNNNGGVGGSGSAACYMPATIQQQTDCGVRDAQLLFQSGRDPEPNDQINLSTLMTQQLENCLPFGSNDGLRERGKKAIPIMRVQPILKQISNTSHVKEFIPRTHATTEFNGNENQQSVVLLPHQLRVLPQQQADNPQTSGFYLLGPSENSQRNVNNGGAPLLINTAQTKSVLSGSLLSQDSLSHTLHQQQPREKAFLKAAAAAYSMVFQLVNPSVNSNSSGSLPGSTTTGHITPPMT